MSHFPVLITGGSGYIGSHIVYTLCDHNIPVIVLDNLSSSRSDSLPEGVPFYQGDILDTAFVTQLIRKHHVGAVIHMAAFLSVEESVQNPLAYYKNNVDGARSIVEACVKTGVKKLIFSSTGATYASSEEQLKETSEQKPSSPYGQSKWMAEQLIRDTVAVTHLKAVILRYFNVVGADPQGRTGQIGTEATHLISRACQTAAGDRETLTIFGTDYPTKDGTCMRDYIHVSDLAEAHRIVLEQDFPEKLKIFNCGYGHGYSVKEIAEKTRTITGVNFPVVLAARRPGDLASTISDNTTLLNETAWTPRYDNIDTIITTAWNWYRQERLYETPAKKRAGQA